MQVPKSSNVTRLPQPAVPIPDQKFLMMAASMMHSAGRLIKPGTETPNAALPPQQATS